MVTISSVGFSGSQNEVPISESFVKSTADSDWIRTYRKFEFFDEIAADYENADRIKKRLESGLALTNGWLRSNEEKFAGVDARLTLDQIAETPYMIDDIIGSSLIGMARRGELRSTPVEISKFVNDKSVTEIADNGESWVLYLRRRNVLFPHGHTQTETERNAIKNLAYSFAYGVGPNIIHVMKRFKASANEDIRELIEVRE